MEPSAVLHSGARGSGGGVLPLTPPRLPRLEDGFGRSFPYLRLSITDACNFRCSYCLPNGYRKTEREDFLTLAEIRRLVSAFAGMGTWKVRLTGGEPTLRRDYLEVARAVAGVPGIRRVALSTNGWNLAREAPAMLDAGIRALNVSVDSLDPAKFRAATGRGALDDVLSGIERALGLGFDSVKVNAVLMKGVNDGEPDLARFLEWTRVAPISVRFIEMMRTGQNAATFDRDHLTVATIRERLLASGWAPLPPAEAGGPAETFAKPGHAGTLGLIAPYSRNFCSSCNRLRVSSRGGLRLCLFGEGTFPLRPYLADDGRETELQQAVRGILRTKDVSHHLEEGRYGNMQSFSSIGG